eukprot:PITA_15639
MKMKNISPSVLPHIHGLTTEDPDTFLFEFVVLCRTYDYVEDEQKLKLFPSTLKDATLRWFMGLPRNSITTWAQMQQAFNTKYIDYCRSKETKGEIFRMTMGNDESLEDYEERFQLSYKHARCTLDPKSLKLVLLRGVPEDLLDTLNLLAEGDIYQLPYEDIKTVFRNHSRAARKRGRRNHLSASTSFSKHEFANQMEELKSEMRQNIAMQLDTFRIQQKKEESERALAIFCPRCMRKHPNNGCPLHSVEVYTGETTCPTHAVEIQEINLRSGKVLLERQPPPLEEEEEKQESEPQAIPPFPERLIVTTQCNPEEDELLGELKQLCVKIPLLQAIKDVPIYNKLIKEKCFRHPGRRKKDASTINVIGQLSDLMLGQVICPKYLDPGNPVVDVHINGTIIPHTLIDLGAAINVMTRDTMLKLNLQSSLRKTSTVLQLADCSTVTPEGIVEDVLVSVDSWEYPADFLVLQPKEKLTGYPLILGRPWLATIDAYINCRAGSMTIKNGPMSKQLVLYPPAQPLLEHDLPL